MISVVVPAFDAARVLPDQLAALEQQRFAGPWELIVADNGSTDDTAAVVRSWAERLPVRLVDASARRGPSAARNLGAAHATGEVLAFSDADDLVMPGWLDAASRLLDGGERFATGPIFRFLDGDDVELRRRDLPARALSHLGYLPYADGTNFLCSRALFDRHGGFDEARLTGEDADLSWRIERSGVELEVLPDAQVGVRSRRDGRAVWRQYYRYGKGDVALYRDFRAYGLERPPAGPTLRSYAGIVARLPLLWSARHRDRWLHQSGRRAGRLVASVQQRSFLP